MAPLVSLAITVYNGEQFIAEAIRSILNHDYQDLELIITDKASTTIRDHTNCIAFGVSTAQIIAAYIRLAKCWLAVDPVIAAQRRLVNSRQTQSSTQIASALTVIPPRGVSA